MYCSSCGVTVTAGLSYCNRCGAEVGAKERSANKLSELSAGSLIWAIVAITIVGLGAVISLLGRLKETPEFAGVIMGFSVLSLLIVLATEILFIWLLLRSKTPAKGAAELSHLKGTPVLRELEVGQAHGLPASTMSVTEHTTRTLEPIPNRKAE
ncbi:MAG: hypothetical protein ABJC05_03515 [Pyrinomonadaceae bacterium]